MTSNLKTELDEICLLQNLKTFILGVDTVCTMNNQGMVQVQLEDLVITVDEETARLLENDQELRQSYLRQIREEMFSKNKIWKTSKNPTKTDADATILFLQLRKELNYKFDDKKTSKNYLWMEIATKMNERNFYVGEGIDGREKCRQKFANLQVSYMKYRDKMRQTGEGAVTKPPYYDELHDILGDKHKSEPLLIIDSLDVSSDSINQASCSKDQALKPTLPFKPGDTDCPTSVPSTSKSQNKFASVKSTVRPNKNDILQKIYESNKENQENITKNFNIVMQYMKAESEQRHTQMMTLLQSMNKKGKKRKRDSSDSD